MTSRIEARLMAKVLVQEDGCWLWTAALDSNGYGKFAVPPRGTWDRAHRVAYRLFVGAIPDGLTLDHLCRNRACVNPAHLEAVTARENILRGEGLGARYARRTRCKNDHEFTPSNTRSRPGGGRICLTCQRAAKRRYDERRRAAA